MYYYEEAKRFNEDEDWNCETDYINGGYADIDDCDGGCGFNPDKYIYVRTELGVDTYIKDVVSSEHIYVRTKLYTVEEIAQMNDYKNLSDLEYIDKYGLPF